MLPSRKRAKLTRVSLKDINGVQLMPRRNPISKSVKTSDFAACKESRPDDRRGKDIFCSETSRPKGNLLKTPSGASSEPALVDHRSIPLVTQTDAFHSFPCDTVKNASLQEHSNRGMKLAKKVFLGCKRKMCGMHSFEGPCTRVRDQLSKPNTRSRQRYVLKLLSRRYWCTCDRSDGHTCTKKEFSKVKRPQNQIKRRKCHTIKSEVVQAAKRQAKEKNTGARKPHLPPVAERKDRLSLPDKQSNRTSLRLITKKYSDDQRGEGQWRVKERPTQCEPDRTAAADTDFLSTGMSSSRPTFTLSNLWFPYAGGFHGDWGAKHKFCADIDTTGNVNSCLEDSPRRIFKTTSCAVYGDCEYNSSRSKNLYKSAISSLKQSDAKKANTILIKSPEKIIVWLGIYPELKVCDVAQKCDVCRHGCGFVLPKVLKTKAVHCFKRDLKAGVRLLPACSGGNEHGSAAGIKSTHSSDFQFGKRCYRFQRLTKRSRNDPRIYTAAETLSNRTLSGVLEVTAREAPAISAFTLPGNHASKTKGRTCTLNRASEPDPGEEADINSVKRRRVERVKIMSIASESCLDSEDGGSDVRSVSKMHGDQRAVATENGASEFSLKGDGFHHCSNDTEQFSCQRVRVYLKKVYFSCARTYMCWPFPQTGPPPATSAGMDACPAEPAHASPRDESEVSLNPYGDPSLSLSVKTNVTFPKNATDYNPGHLASPQRDAENGEDNEMPALSTWKKQRESRDGSSSTYSCDQASSSPILGDDTSDTISGCCSSSCTPNNSDRFSATFSPQPNRNGCPLYTLPVPCLSGSRRTIRKPLLNNKETDGTSINSIASSPSTSSDSTNSYESYLLLPREELGTEGTFSKSDQDHNHFPFADVPYVRGNESNRAVSNHPDEWSEIGLSWSYPLLSPVSSPQRPSSQSFLSKTPRCPDPEDNIDNVKAFCIANGKKDETNDNCSKKEGNIVESILEKELTDAEIKATATSGAPIDPSGGGGDWASETEEQLREDEMAGDHHLDEFTAYEQDILLVDIVQDDPNLFLNLPKKSSLKLGPTRNSGSCGPVKLNTGEPAVSTRTDRPSWETDKYVSTAAVQHSSTRPEDLLAILDEEDESSKRPWRASCSSRSFSSQQRSSNWLLMANQTKTTRQLKDDNNNHVTNPFERVDMMQTPKSLNGVTNPVTTVHGGRANTTEFRLQKYSAYCRNYFSETLACRFKICRFQHVPLEGDEKFCVETVMRFTKNPLCLQKASAVFTDYYKKNSPGPYFSLPVLTSLLWALLNASLVSDIVSVLNASFEHKIMPGPDFLLALLNHVREKGLTACAPQVSGLMSKMADAGLVQSLDYLNCVQNSPKWQQTNSPVLTSASNKLPLLASTPFPDTHNLAHALMEIELCIKQEDWGRIGRVFRSFCMSGQGPNELDRMSGHIAIALLSETKDKLSLPFASFSDAVIQGENGKNDLIKSFIGRIGVSLMFRYYRTHQWIKGRKLLEILSRLKVNYSMLKGLFGNEDGASRCCLVTMATELFLLSGSVEGALHTLRENEWFLSSHSWPCEPCDLDKRQRVLIRLMEKTSHRDALEILSNLPGLKEPSDGTGVSQYGPLCNSHLRVCLERQMFPVASDTVVFMLSKKLPVEPGLLCTLLNKLGMQNMWLRARTVFKCSLSMGYYPGVYAPPGLLGMTLPSLLGEVELALTLEMFITVNATALVHLTDETFCLCITLKRTHSCERAYLAAASRLLSAAGVLQPKLSVSFTVVNASQEQVFKVDVPSARLWLRHNHMWANAMWTHLS